MLRLLVNIRANSALLDSALIDRHVEQYGDEALLTHELTEPVRKALSLAFMAGVRVGADEQHHEQLRRIADVIADMEKRHKELQTAW
jgi:hypothetical protein